MSPGGRVRPAGSKVRLRGPEGVHVRRGRGPMSPGGHVRPAGSGVRLRGPEGVHARRSGRPGGRCSSPADACARRGLEFSCAGGRARPTDGDGSASKVVSDGQRRKSGL